MSDLASPVADPTPEPTPTPAPVGDAPWANDLVQLVPDETLRGAVDGYLRENWQPRMTQLEMDLAAAKDARELVSQLEDQEHSVSTYLAMAEELYGEEVAQAVAGALGINVTDDPEPTNVTEPSPQEPELPAHIQEMYDTWQAQEAEKLYVQEVGRVREAVGDGFDEDLFHPMVVSAEGDFDKALELYNAKVEQIQQRYAPPPPVTEPPPAVLGQDGVQGATPTATEPKYDSVDDAIDDYFKDLNASPPTTVGSV